MPSSNRVENFKSAIQLFERSGDGAPLIDLFADDATLDAPSRKIVLHGKSGAIEFWNEYREAFESVLSRFTRENVAGELAVLEWISSGTLPTGRPIEYRGVSLLTFREQKIASFTTYYDSAAFCVETVAAADRSLGTNNEGGD